MAVEHREIIGREVRALLAQAPAYAALPEGDRARLAADMVHVVSALAGAPPAAAPDADAHIPTAEAGGAATGAAIDFPRFAATLVQGTFHAILNASRDQMKAYADLLGGIASSLPEDGAAPAITAARLRGQVADLLRRDPAIREHGWPPKH